MTQTFRRRTGMRKDRLESLVGKVIKVDRHGPNSRVGKLLSVSDDFFTLLTEDDGIVYIATHHIKSITENTRNNIKFNVELPEGFKYHQSSKFHHLLNSLCFQSVKINRGPEKIEGVLHEANSEYFTVISDEEVIHLSTFHIKNLTFDHKFENKNKDDKNKEDDKKDDNKNDRADSSKKKSTLKTVAWLGSSKELKGKTYFGIPYKYGNKKKRQSK